MWKKKKKKREKERERLIVIDFISFRDLLVFILKI
jgi:hypothetical protein